MHAAKPAAVLHQNQRKLA